MSRGNGVGIVSQAEDENTWLDRIGGRITTAVLFQ